MRIEHECVQTDNKELVPDNHYTILKDGYCLDVYVKSVNIIDDDSLLVVRYVDTNSGADGVVGVNMNFRPFQEWVIM